MMRLSSKYKVAHVAWTVVGIVPLPSICAYVKAMVLNSVDVNVLGARMGSRLGMRHSWSSMSRYVYASWPGGYTLEKNCEIAIWRSGFAAGSSGNVTGNDPFSVLAS